MNKRKSGIALALAAMCTGLTLSSAVAAKDELNVGYFLEWPTANQIAQVEKTYDEVLGVTVNWKPFDNGNAMNAAMVAGDIDINYSIGFPPFVVGVTKGVDMQLVSVAVTYSENDNCVVRSDAGITKANAKDLEGKKVGTPTGNATHYKLLSTLKHLGVDSSKVRIVSMENSDVHAALARGDIVMGCAFGGSLTRMKEYGDVLMTGAEQEAVGISVFDVVSASGDLVRNHPELVQGFLQVTEDANKKYRKSPKKYYPLLSKAAGMSLESTIDSLSKFAFPLKGDLLKSNWLGGGVQKAAKDVADLFVELGQLPKALSQEGYSKTINASFMKKVK